MTPYEFMIWVVIAAMCGLMAFGIYADQRVKHYDRLLEKRRAEREAAE